MEYIKKEVMNKPKKRGYIQPLYNPGEGTNFNYGSGGAYSKADGTLMSGTNHGGDIGYGGRDALGNTKDVAMGGLNKEGTSQRVFAQHSKDAYDNERGMALTSGNTMDDYSSTSLYGVKSQSEPQIESGMPGVDVSPRSGNINDADHGADIGNYNAGASEISKQAARSKASWGGGSLSKRQSIRLGKGGRKAERQLNRIERKAARKKRRGKSV